ncbi:MAG: hypothetical protein AABX11_06060 [Nanoarchaeota archaeon]
MNEDELKKEGLRSIKESDIAWEEFFKDKPKPQNDEEDKKQQEEFYHWYNYVRKQSDTGKTPAEMFKEIYGKEPPQNFPISSQQDTGRMMNFEWDDEYDDEDNDEFSKEIDNFLNSVPKKCFSCKEQILLSEEDAQEFERGLCSGCYEKMSESEKDKVMQDDKCYIETNEDEDDYFDEEEEDDQILKEVEDIADEMFEDSVWANSKEDVKAMSRRDSSQHMFRLGFYMHAKYSNYQMRELSRKMKNMSKEEMEELMNNINKKEDEDDEDE